MRVLRKALLTLLAFLISSLNVATVAAAADLTREIAFDIPAQPLAQALTDFSRQSDVIVVAASELTTGKLSQPVNATTTAAKALTQLLEGSNLVYTQEKDGSIIVKKPVKISMRKADPPGDPSATSLSSDPLQAEQTPSQDSAKNPKRVSLEEIVVTARRREETIQDVPATVSVLTNAAIFESGNDSMEHLRDVIPNLQFASDVPVRSRVSVRGLGSDRSGTQANGVGFFIDGVYQTSTARFNLPFFDVERIEILEGPQGARYGRNAYAGVINMVTRKPDNTVRGDVDVGIETKGGIKVAEMISGPLIPDRLYGKISYARSESDGDYRNAFTSRLMAPSDSDSFTARLVADVTENFALDTSYSKSNNKGGGFAVSETQSLQNLVENFVVADNQSTAINDHDFYIKASWSGDSVKIMNLLGYNKEIQSFVLDGDVTRFNGVLSTGRFNFETWSNELRVQSVDGGALTWMFGGEVVSQESFKGYKTLFGPQVDLALLGATNPAFVTRLAAISPVTNGISGDLHSWSPFAEVSYNFGPLEVTASAREDNIKQSAFNPKAGPTGSGLGKDIRERPLQPLLSFRYRVDADTSVYASAARGIRQGGFNAASLTRSYGAFGEDTVLDYEVGLKHAMPQLRGYVNFAAFYMDAGTINHASIILTDTGTLSAGAVTLGGAISKGLELDASVQPHDHITLGLGAGYLDCKYVNIPPVADRSPDLQRASLGDRNGDRCQDSSVWTINASITGDYPVSDDWTAVGTLSLAGKGNTRIGIDPLFRENQMTQDPYWLVNLTAGAKRGHFSIFAYAENLTNRLYATSNQSAELLRDNGVLGATGSATVLAPRLRLGIKARWEF
jgi:iron complex outermembrane receptor protein